jgi:acyl carrier protein
MTRDESAEAGRREDLRVIQRDLLAAWQGIVQNGQIGLDQNFFESGGSSLHLVQLRTTLVREFGAEVRLVELFGLATVRKLAERIYSRETE